MPQRNRSLFKTFLLPLGLLAMLIAVVRRRPDDWEYEPAAGEPQPVEAQAPAADESLPRPARRVALAAAFTVLFFAGASFTAGAGDQMAKLVEDEPAVEAAEPEAAAASTEEAPAEDGPVEEAPVEEAPVEEAPVEEAPVEEAPVEEAPVEEASAEEAPAEAAPAEAAPVEPAPSEAAPVEAAPAEAAPAEAAPAEIAPAAVPAEAAPEASPSEPSATAPATVRAKAKAPAAAMAPQAKARPAKGTKQWVVKRAEETPAEAPEIEHEGHGQPTVWLNRALPDPTPPSARLARPFARNLVAISRRHHADWAAVLGILRAQGERGSRPATAQQLDTLARRVGRTNAWNAALALSGRTAFADRAQALADLYRFVGVETLVDGYAKSKDRLARKIVETEGILVYAGGREDIVAGRIDVRVLALIGYLARRHDGVTVTSLFSGHRMFSRPGVVSAHMYGHAVDIAAVGGTPIFGNQRPGGITEEAVRSVLLLPSELQPRQVISLLGLGGPSFPMRDHGDHIHVGY
ncbi:MAG TPA: hypothetical protein VD704_04345 [Gaiellaceae bacterium]|nr:hypothetical protein [Gaiellaceae bacterium]